MSEEFVVHGAVPLQDGGTLVIDEGREMLLYVWQGMVWVTQEGDRRDYVLSRGDWLRVERGGRTVVTALARSSLALTSPYDEHYAEGIALSGRGLEQAVPMYNGKPRSLGARLNRVARAWAAWISPRPEGAAA